MSRIVFFLQPAAAAALTQIKTVKQKSKTQSQPVATDRKRLRRPEETRTENEGVTSSLLSVYRRSPRPAEKASLQRKSFASENIKRGSESRGTFGTFKTGVQKNTPRDAFGLFLPIKGIQRGTEIALIIFPRPYLFA
jgi:hypothetical protein